MPSTVTRPQSEMSPEAFATLGTSSIAYVRAVRSEDLGFRYPEAPLLIPGHTIFVLHAADGTPLVMSDSFEEVAGDAANYQLETVSLH